MKKKNKHDVYRGNGGMKKSCESLRQHAMKKKNKIINKQTTRIILATLYLMHNNVILIIFFFAIFVKKSLKINILKINNTVKLEIIVIILMNTEDNT